MTAQKYFESQLNVPITPNIICKSLDKNEIYTGVFNAEKLFICKIDGIYSLCTGHICAINTWSTGIVKSLRFRVEKYKYITTELNELILLIEECKKANDNRDFDTLYSLINKYELLVHNLFSIPSKEFIDDNSKRTIETVIYQNYLGITNDVVKLFSSILDEYIM